MRASALVAAALVFAAGSAAAETWTDPAGRLSFDKPSGWSVSQENMPNVTYVVAGTADNECHIIAIPRDQLASAAARDIQRAGADDAQFGPDTWAQRANAIPSIFPNNSANVLSRSSETDRVWPIQRAEIQAPERLVHAAVQVRPGVELLTFCQTYEGDDPTATYDSVIRSVGHPNDATWQAQAEQQRAEREAAAAQAPPAEEAAEQEEQQQRQRRRTGRGITAGESNPGAGGAPM
jgi:hypothetical protein